MAVRQVVTWRFAPWDSWYFHELTPWGAPGGGGTRSVFPPPAPTIAGAVRAAITKYVADVTCAERILQRLRLTGPYLTRSDRRMYRAPAALVLADVKRPDRIDRGVPRRLRPAGVATACDLGDVRLPSPGESRWMRETSLDEHWVTDEGMQDFLAGKVPAPGELVADGDLVVRDPRTGIRRDFETRVAVEDNLFSTEHVRLADGVAFEVGLTLGAESVETRALIEMLPERGNIAFGGEGRMASFARVDAAPAPRAPACSDEQCFTAYFATAAAFGPGGSADWRAWEAVQPIELHLTFQAYRAWRCAPFARSRRGRPAPPLEFDIVSACTYRPAYEGGYETRLRAPRAVSALMPAGSTWFCALPDGRTIADVVSLHGAQLGSGREIGHGEVFVGVGWGDHG